MDFEEMQVIWDSQREQPMYAVDLEALHRSVRRKAGQIQRGVTGMELAMIGIAFALAVLLAWKPLTQGVDYHRLLGAALFAGMSAMFLRARVLRRRRERLAPATLLGDLERALAQVDYHIARARTFQWWFLLPAGVVLTSRAIFSERDKPLWVWALLAAALALSWWLPRLELRCSLLPRKRDLEALRTTLTARD